MKGNFEQLINSDMPVLVDFFAEWCGPCKAMAPALQQVAGSMQGKARIVKIDIDRNQALAGKLNVRAVPTFIIFKNGKEVWRKMGAVPAHVIQQQLQEAAN